MKEKPRSTKFGAKNLSELPALSKFENIHIWLESQEPDDCKCDCFEPDYVHYACVDVTTWNFHNHQDFVLNNKD